MLEIVLLDQPLELQAAAEKVSTGPQVLLLGLLELQRLWRVPAARQVTATTESLELTVLSQRSFKHSLHLALLSSVSFRNLFISLFFSHFLFSRKESSSKSFGIRLRFTMLSVSCLSANWQSESGNSTEAELRLFFQLQ